MHYLAKLEDCTKGCSNKSASDFEENEVSRLIPDKVVLVPEQFGGYLETFRKIYLSSTS